MLRIIFLSLCWAICATCFVRPVFWKKLKNKEKKSDIKVMIVLSIFFFMIVFIFSFATYYTGLRQNLYDSLIIILMCCVVQMLISSLLSKKINISIVIGIVSIILCVQDNIVGNKIVIPLKIVENVPLLMYDDSTKIKLFVSADEIKSLFKADSASGPTYNNGKYIFAISGKYTGKGIVTIDKNNCDEANFIQCSYELDVTELRFKYPTQKLEKLYITISDENEPYGLFAILDKSWFLGTYDVSQYVMLNLVTGDIQELSLQELPSFVTKN